MFRFFAVFFVFVYVCFCFSCFFLEILFVFLFMFFLVFFMFFHVFSGFSGNFLHFHETPPKISTNLCCLICFRLFSHQPVQILKSAYAPGCAWAMAWQAYFLRCFLRKLRLFVASHPASSHQPSASQPAISIAVSVRKKHSSFTSSFSGPNGPARCVY